MDLAPLEDRIVIHVAAPEKVTGGGIILPPIAQEAPQQGEVVAVGPGATNPQTGARIPMDVQEGDTVIFSRYGGTEVRHRGEDYTIISAKDVFAVLATL
jgi:chaperonin GroES